MHWPMHELYFSSFAHTQIKYAHVHTHTGTVGVGCSNEPLLRRLLDPTLTEASNPPSLT